MNEIGLSSMQLEMQLRLIGCPTCNSLIGQDIFGNCQIMYESLQDLKKKGKMLLFFRKQPLIFIRQRFSGYFWTGSASVKKCTSFWTVAVIWQLNSYNFSVFTQCLLKTFKFTSEIVLAENGAFIQRNETPYEFDESGQDKTCF